MSFLWSDPAFVDFVCREPFGLPTAQLGTSCADPVSYPRSLQFLSRLLNRLLSDPSIDSAILPPWLKHALARAQQSIGVGCVALDVSSWTRLVALIRATPNSVTEQLTALVAETVGRVRGLQPGANVIFPGGIAVDGEKPPVFLLFSVARPLNRPQFMEFAVINATGYGAEYQAFQVHANPSSAVTGSIQSDFLLVLENVFPDRLMHSSFWLCVYHLLARPAPTNIHTLYAVLLPHLNCKPLLSNWKSRDADVTGSECLPSEQRKRQSATPSSPPLTGSPSTDPLISKQKLQHLDDNAKGGAWFPAPPLRTTGSAVAGALACLHHVLQSTCQLNLNEISIVNILLWWSACLICCDDLAMIVSATKCGGESFSGLAAAAGGGFLIGEECSAFHLAVVRWATR